MKTDSNLTIYKASAGSGKTFRLAVRYITMLVRNPQSYSTILAVTFTNKATAEMKQRILSQLYGIGHRLESSQGYYNEIRKAIPTYTEDTIRHNATLALDSILQDYGHFRVETIDSFFQGILKGMARELQLGNGLTIELDTEKVISDAVDDFLANIEPESQDKKNVMRFIMGNIENDSNWNIDSSLKKFSKELFSEIFMQKGEILKKILETPDAIKNYQENLIKARDAVLPGLKEQVITIGNEIAGAMTAAGFGIGDFHRNIKGSIKGMTNGDILAKDLTKTVHDSCTDARKFFTGDTLKACPSLLGLAGSQFCPRMAQVIGLHEKYSYWNHSYTAALQYLHELSLLLSVRKRIDDQGREQGRFVLADTAKLLQDLKSSDTSFVFEKTGSFTDHIMIDEFQDTSALQWSNLYLLLLECLSRGRECLVVGDVKQSIYRWRGSDWNILNTGIEASLNDYCQVEPMSDNYRSQKEVIDFNNSLFPVACKEVQDYLKVLTDSDNPALDKAYDDVRQNCKKDKDGGFVSVTVFEKQKNIDATAFVCEKTADCLDRLTEAGVQQKDIAMLFRKGKEIASVASWFAANRPEYRLISSEAFRLDSSAPVRILIGALRWIANSNDRISLATMLWEWNHSIMKSDVTIQDITATDIGNSLPPQLAGQHESLRQMPLYELIEKLYVDLSLDKAEGQDQYIFTFLDLVSEWLGRNPSDLGMFLSDWDEKLHAKTIPSTDADGIRMLTVHKSKGLEFHTVIIPFCDWELTKTGDKLWVGPDSEPFNSIPLLPIGFEGSLRTSVFKKQYADEAGQQAVDNLNLLYVAFTRAESNLIVFASRHNDNGNSMCNILENCLFSKFDCQYDGDGQMTYERGTVSSSVEKAAETSDNPFSFTPEPQQSVMRSLPLNVQFRQSGESVRFTQSAQDPEDRQEDYIKRGSLLHSLFSTVRTESDVDVQVDTMFGGGLIDSREDAGKLKADIHAHIADSGVKDWFNGKFRLFNETSILFRENGVMQTRRPDRVMIMPDGRAVVVDFKFGTEREEYMHQVQEYMDLLRKMGFKNVEGYIWYVYKNKLTHI